MNKSLRDYFSKIGRKGGKAGSRTLTTAQAKAMVLAREEKKKGKKGK